MSERLAYADAAASPEVRAAFLARLADALRHERLTRLGWERAQRLAALRGPRAWRAPTEIDAAVLDTR